MFENLIKIFLNYIKNYFTQKNELILEQQQQIMEEQERTMKSNLAKLFQNVLNSIPSNNGVGDYLSDTAITITYDESAVYASIPDMDTKHQEKKFQHHFEEYLQKSFDNTIQYEQCTFCEKLPLNEKLSFEKYTVFYKLNAFKLISVTILVISWEDGFLKISFKFDLAIVNKFAPQNLKLSNDGTRYIV